MIWWLNKLNKRMSIEIENSLTVHKNKVLTFKSIPMKISSQKNQAKEHKNNQTDLWNQANLLQLSWTLMSIPFLKNSVTISYQVANNNSLRNYKKWIKENLPLRKVLTETGQNTFKSITNQELILKSDLEWTAFWNKPRNSSKLKLQKLWKIIAMLKEIKAHLQAH